MTRQAVQYPENMVRDAERAIRAHSADPDGKCSGCRRGGVEIRYAMCEPYRGALRVLRGEPQSPNA